MRTTATNILGLKKCVQHSDEKETTQLLELKNQLRQVYQLNKSPANKAGFHKIWCELQFQKRQEVQNPWFCRKPAEIQHFVDCGERKKFFEAFKTSNLWARWLSRAPVTQYSSWRSHRFCRCAVHFQNVLQKQSSHLALG